MTSTELVSTKTRHLRQLLRMALGQDEIGRRIAQAREEASLSQRELADLIGVADAQSISRYERGVTEVKTKRLEKIAAATGKPLGYFVIELPDEAGEAPGGDERISPDTLTELLEATLENQRLLGAVLERLSALEAERQVAPTPPEDAQESASVPAAPPRCGRPRAPESP
jgi:transcriptional regulator with XRE-family HTH domain